MQKAAGLDIRDLQECMAEPIWNSENMHHGLAVPVRLRAFQVRSHATGKPMVKFENK